MQQTHSGWRYVSGKGRVAASLAFVDDDEVVDELLQLSDSLLSDSLIDSLLIDSTEPYHVYQNDSAPITDLGIGRWALSQYKY